MAEKSVNRHIIEVAKARVLIENGVIHVLSQPRVSECPVHRVLSGRTDVTVEQVRHAVERMINEHGMFTKDRVVETFEELVPFGASEMLMSGLRHGLIDCVVTACDCAGTIVTTKPEVVQGIGKKMTGLIETSPVEEVIEKLERKGTVVIDTENAVIDQVEGVKQASELGYKRIAVTVTGMEAGSFKALRNIEVEHKIKLWVLAVHNSGIDAVKAKLLAEGADLVWACASKAVRVIVGPKALLQIGIQIPVFALTEQGKELILTRMKDLKQQLLVTHERLPKIIKGKHPNPLT